jgi:UDP-N-acetylmuramate dehydrogenase
MERKLRTEFSLGDLNWFPSGGAVGTFLQPAHMADLAEFLRDLALGTEIQVLGRGSNTLFSGDRFDGVVVYLGDRFGGFEILPDRTLRAGAGALMADVARSAMVQGLDITFLGAVPGTVGGAIVGNAGFLGKSICDYVMRATVVLRDGSIQTLKRATFAHPRERTKALKGAVMIQAVLALPEGEPEDLQESLTQTMRQHRAIFPDVPACTGYVFSAESVGPESGVHQAASTGQRRYCTVSEISVWRAAARIWTALSRTLSSQKMRLTQRNYNRLEKK